MRPSAAAPVDVSAVSTPRPTASESPPRCLTVDVEEYFQIEAARAAVPPAAWSQWPSRVEAQMQALLERLARHRCRATLFFLGHVAQDHPALVRRCHDAGHEIACHGFCHDRLDRMDAATLKADVTAAKALLEDLTGAPVLGYRAPSWSLTRRTRWAIDVLLEAGFVYDSSIFPVRHPAYGIADAPTRPYVLAADRAGRCLLELPPLTWRVAGHNVPVAGGAYFRALPLAAMRAGLAQAGRERRPAVLYFHPWEFDPDLPALPLGRLGRWRTYTGLGRTLPRLDRLLASPGRWITMRELARRCGQSDRSAAAMPGTETTTARAAA